MLNRFLCFAVLFVFQTVAAAEPSWTVFNGIKGNNVSPETGLLKSWGENGPPLLWKANGIGNTEFPGYSAVTVADGRIYTSGTVRIGDSDQTANAVVYCLDENTGKEIWHYDNGTAWTDKGRFPGERSTPTIDGDRIYAVSAVGKIACLNAANGKEIWTRNLREEYTAQLPEWAYAESVVIDGNKAVFWVGGEKAAVVAMDKMTGKTIWETPGTGQRSTYCTMTAFDCGGLRIYANMNQKGLLAVNGETGGKLFFFPYETKYDVMATTPYYFDGKLFLNSGYGTGTKLLKLNVSGKAVTPEVIWEEPKFDNMHGGIVIKDGYAYGASHFYKGGNWMCVKIADGSIAWENRGIGMGATTFADGMLYCMSEKNGSVALVKASPEKYEEASRFTLPEEGAGMYWAHPVVCGGKLYLRHANFLYCYDIKAK